MSRTARLWKGVGPWTLGGLLLSGGIAAYAGDTPSLSEQLVSLGRQAASQGKPEEAKTFYRNALKLDPDQRRRPSRAWPGLGWRASRFVPGPRPAEMAPPAGHLQRLRLGIQPPPPRRWWGDPTAPADHRRTSLVASPNSRRSIRTSGSVPTRSLARRSSPTSARRLQAARDMTNAGNPDAALNGAPERLDHRSVRHG